MAPRSAPPRPLRAPPTQPAGPSVAFSNADPHSEHPLAATQRSRSRRPDRTPRRRNLWQTMQDDERGVTPVIGSIFVLAITVFGVAAILLWGAPTIQRIQDRNAQLSIIGEFEDLKVAAESVTVPDASRNPTLVISDGVLGLQTGSRFLIAIPHDPGYTSCDFWVEAWESSPVNEVTVTASSCRSLVVTASCGSLAATEACLEILRVAGSSTVAQTVVSGGLGYSSTAPNGSDSDFTSGDWLFRLTDGDATNPEVYAEAWLLETDAYFWEKSSSGGERAAYLDANTIFTKQGESWFIESGLPMQEDAFGSGDYVLWLRTMSAVTQDAIQSRGTAQASLSLLANHVRLDSDDATQIRYGIHGQFSEPWCNALQLRNNDITTGTYTVDGTADCESTVPSITYVPTGGGAFSFEFLHADIRANIFL